MIAWIPQVLTQKQLRDLCEELNVAPFVDGRVTAAEPAKHVKKNLQLDESDYRHAKLSKQVSDAVLANALFQLAVWPRTLLPFRFGRYDSDMGYGQHVDD